MSSLQMSAPFISEKIFELIKEIPTNTKVLDIATGKGYLVKLLESRGYTNLHCADINEKNFRYNKKNFHFKRVNANKKLPYRNKEFGLIISSETIEHVENPRLFLQEISRILAKNGTFILTTPNIETIFSKLYFLFSSGLAGHTDNDYKVSGHITVLPSWTIERFSNEAGFNIVDKQYNCGYIPLLRIKTQLLSNKLFGWVSIYKFQHNKE